ncbi:MAG TPA: YdcH family protein [Pyrinomonadaceae bacterium]|nr:YdcH family protein [Pyrinomonadaceae bacterium]
MEMTNTDGLKEQLIASDPEFRELAREHGRYEQRLSELSSLQFPSDEEQLEEITLKKKKLAVKDQMHAIMLRHQRADSVTH